MLKTEMYFLILLVLMLVIVIDQGNDEIQMTNDEGMTKSELGKIVSDSVSSFEHSDLLRASTFELRH
jgi:hypothetical protein